MEQKLSPLFKRNISDLLSLVEILQIVSHVSFCSLLLLMLPSCFYLGFSFKCQPFLFQNHLKAWYFCKFLCFFYCDLTEYWGLFHGEDLSLYVTNFSVFLSS